MERMVRIALFVTNDQTQCAHSVYQGC